MKKLFKQRIFYGLIVLLGIFSVAYSQEGTSLVEDWEKKHNDLQPPVKIMDTIGLKPGMTIGDIGAGKGRFAVWFAQRVGKNGKVYANDIDKEALDHLKERCEKHGFDNVIICLGEITEPNIPEGVLDIAFMINVYHHLDEPVELLKNIAPTLKPGGVLVIVEHDPVKSGWPRDSSTTKKEMKAQAKKAGYKLIKIEDFLKNDYIYFFKPAQ